MGYGSLTVNTINNMKYTIDIPDKVAYKTKRRTKTLSLDIYYNDDSKNEFFTMVAALKARNKTTFINKNILSSIVKQLPKYKEMIIDCIFISELFGEHRLMAWWSTPKQFKYIVENNLLYGVVSHNSLCKRLFNAGLLYDSYNGKPFKYGEKYREDELLFSEYREKLTKYIAIWKTTTQKTP